MDDKRKYEKTDVPFVEVCVFPNGIGMTYSDISQYEVTRMERILIIETAKGLKVVPYPAILLTRGDVQMILEQDHVNAMVKLLTEQADG